ncbi:Scr1 family TA system antitoxin-like transcriptional regulator [Nocardia farcinica]|uniref:Scr1 family TA system antitoxin-like transcriptional regulator n=1 Tax=Nocardia farcinica TaxID=37329 RepID=UPI002158D7A5|nr:Scr1 family TA system antitoxin-like transcriptional regulator [Nocardia farcinica]
MPGLGPDDPPLAIGESLADDVLLRGHIEIAHHDKLWQRLHHIALPPQESRQLISEGGRGGSATVRRFRTRRGGYWTITCTRRARRPSHDRGFPG